MLRNQVLLQSWQGHPWQIVRACYREPLLRLLPVLPELAHPLKVPPRPVALAVRHTPFQNTAQKVIDVSIASQMRLYLLPFTYTE